MDPSGAWKGSLTASVRSLPDVAQVAATDGTQTTATTKTPGQNARFTFAGTAATVLAMSVSGQPGSTNGGNGSMVTLTAPDHSIVYQGWTDWDGNLWSDQVRLPSGAANTGTYTIAVDNARDWVGPTSVHLAVFT